MTKDNFEDRQPTEAAADDRLFRNALIAYAIIEAILLIPLAVYLILTR